MDILSSIIKLFFGSKADKDRKQIEPYVQKIKDIYPSIEKLTNDELRAHSAALMKQIADFIAEDEAHIVEQKAKLELAETTLSEKEKISKDIETTKKRIDDKIEQKLDEILPEAFAIMKDTARRFTENEVVEVTATQFDRIYYITILCLYAHDCIIKRLWSHEHSISTAKYIIVYFLMFI